MYAVAPPRKIKIPRRKIQPGDFALFVNDGAVVLGKVLSVKENDILEIEDMDTHEKRNIPKNDAAGLSLVDRRGGCEGDDIFEYEE